MNNSRAIRYLRHTADVARRDLYLNGSRVRLFGARWKGIVDVNEDVCFILMQDGLRLNM